MLMVKLQSHYCAVAGLGGNPYATVPYAYYVNERRKDNDPKATGFYFSSVTIK
jgi:unsaturated rhamnogalacturonyl hydrolase